MNSGCNQAGFAVFNGIVNSAQIVGGMKKMRAGMYHGAVLRHDKQQQGKANDVSLVCAS